MGVRVPLGVLEESPPYRWFDQTWHTPPVITCHHCRLENFNNGVELKCSSNAAETRRDKYQRRRNQSREPSLNNTGVTSNQFRKGLNTKSEQGWRKRVPLPCPPSQVKEVGTLAINSNS
ncbi:unnamed protein product [Pleuronectes platessa]|uniref:Uncharacterized protein n=1 Tax=Pleuronectes platessa TaxID=8262 RepID=A0A9N7VK98_PLEPL|nr:unnamed protein product [Pleuronectes platessa]